MSRGDLFSVLCAVVFALHIVVVGHYSPMIGFEPLAVMQVALRRHCWVSCRFARFGAGAVSRDGRGGSSRADYGLLATALAFTDHGMGSAIHDGHAGRL